MAATIESALAQSGDIEIIVVDDGSTDGSLAEIQRFDGRIRWVTGPNCGGSAARNTGVQLASGDWIQFLDADDVLAPNKISEQLKTVNSCGFQTIGFCPWTMLYDNGDEDRITPQTYWRDFDFGIDLLLQMWLLGGFFPPHAWLIPKSLITQIGGWNVSLTGNDDGEFIGRLLVQPVQLRFTPDTYVKYRNPPPGSVSRNRSKASAQSFLESWTIVTSKIKEQRWDTEAKKACLSRLRKIAYSWRHMPDIISEAAIHERRLGVFDLSPSLPPATRSMIGILGLKRGLQLRNLLRK